MTELALYNIIYKAIETGNTHEFYLTYEIISLNLTRLLEMQECEMKLVQTMHITTS